MNVRFTKTALRQLQSALAYIADRDPDAARRVAGRVQTIIELLGLHPEAGEATDRSSQRRIATTPYPYVVFYRVGKAEIIIQRIRHAARRPL
ncbi:type II toxin-antitoxin system RelE/ParE family toxin [Beijerinckia sp. L45]|uniref:type II toxin-antitoxin system RelE/ParE family toxin n=1 Tax=Beijerinckia sp. L45 TaxID=1641855 RepID=UPI00131B0E8A|nr:type II toxin-antitoxin system RelE/ParE family toxin [Beijerinckia sp. L45]